MPIQYCLPIAESRFSVAQHLIRTEEQRFRYFELWTDYLEPHPKADDLRPLVRELSGRMIVTSRRANLETPQASPALRRQLTEGLLGEDLYFDFDLTTQSEDLPATSARRGKSKLILSYHNYQATPAEPELQELVTRMTDRGADLIKIAAHCESPKDVLRLLELRLQLKAKRIPAIVLGMGEHGMATRIFGTLWGNQMIFAPVDRDRTTAAGQLTRDELEQIFSNLRIK